MEKGKLPAGSLKHLSQGRSIRRSWFPGRAFLSFGPGVEIGAAGGGGETSTAIRLQPPADINLRVRFPAIMPRTHRIRRFLGPLEHREPRAAALNHQPFHRALALFPAYFASIDRINQNSTSHAILNRPLSHHTHSISPALTSSCTIIAEPNRVKCSRSLIRGTVCAESTYSMQSLPLHNCL